MAVSSGKTLYPGCYLRPSDQELLVDFLRPRISGHPPAADFIYDADVYSAGPAALTDGYTPSPASNGKKVWYFFSPLTAKNPRDRRPSRTVGTGEGRWHLEKSADPVLDEEGHRVGHRRNLSFKNKNGDRLGWLMVEFGVDQEEDASPVMVICKIYRSPRAPRAETFVATSTALSGSKRKVADEHPEIGTRVRRRHSPSLEVVALQTERAAEEDTRGILRILEEAVMADEPDIPQGADAGDSWAEGDTTEYSSRLELLLDDEPDHPQHARADGTWPEAAALQTERTAEEDARGKLRILEEAVMADEPDMPQGAGTGGSWTEGDVTEYRSMLELMLEDKADHPQHASAGGSSTEGDAAGFSCILERLEGMLMADEGSLAAEISPVESYECSIPVPALEPDTSLPWWPSWASESCGDDFMFTPALPVF